jgi:hypothetical protein
MSKETDFKKVTLKKEKLYQYRPLDIALVKIFRKIAIG